MLYERWRQIAREYRSETALRELSSNRQWTFQELCAQTERAEPAGSPVIYPQGITPEFVLTVLRAWRNALEGEN